jgi:hypothetical protein
MWLYKSHAILTTAQSGGLERWRCRAIPLAPKGDTGDHNFNSRLFNSNGLREVLSMSRSLVTGPCIVQRIGDTDIGILHLARRLISTEN